MGCNGIMSPVDCQESGQHDQDRYSGIMDRVKQPKYHPPQMRVANAGSIVGSWFLVLGYLQSKRVDNNTNRSNTNGREWITLIRYIITITPIVGLWFILMCRVLGRPFINRSHVLLP